MYAFIDLPFSIGYAWDDGPEEHFATREEAIAEARKWRADHPEGAPIYVFQLLEIA